MPERPATIDHWAIEAALPNDRLCYYIQRHNNTVERLIEEISETQTEKATVIIEPAAWLELRDKLSMHSLKPTDWSAEVEKDKYDELLAFLTRGELPNSVSMGAQHIPALTDAQAAGVLWFLNEVTGLDINDIRYGPCDKCGDMTISDQTISCEGCEVRMCEDCFAANAGGNDHDIDEWWPETLNDSHCYCDKCVEVVKAIVHKSLDTPEKQE